MAGISRHRYLRFNIQKTIHRRDADGIETYEDTEHIVNSLLIMDFSLLSPLEFFVVPKNGDGRNNKPPAMRVRVDCYTKKLPFRLQ